MKRPHQSCLFRDLSLIFLCRSVTHFCMKAASFSYLSHCQCLWVIISGPVLCSAYATMITGRRYTVSGFTMIFSRGFDHVIWVVVCLQYLFKHSCVPDKKQHKSFHATFVEKAKEFPPDPMHWSDILLWSFHSPVHLCNYLWGSFSSVEQSVIFQSKGWMFDFSSCSLHVKDSGLHIASPTAGDGISKHL